MIIGALFSVLEVRTENIDSLPIKAEQLIYLLRRTPEKKFDDRPYKRICKFTKCDPNNCMSSNPKGCRRISSVGKFNKTCKKIGFIKFLMDSGGILVLGSNL